MPISFKVDKINNLLRISLIKVSPLDEFLLAKKKILRLRKKYGINRVLVDASQREESLGMMELLDIGKHLSDESLFGLRIALFSEKPQPGIEFTRQVAAVNHGATVNTFSTEQSALAWLNTQPAAGVTP